MKKQLSAGKYLIPLITPLIKEREELQIWWSAAESSCQSL